MGIEGIVLEHHGDIPLAGRHLVDPPVAHPQLAAADLLQSCNHPQGGGLAAAGGAHQHDELLVRNVQVEILYRHHALVGDLKIVFLLRLALFLFLLGVGIDFLEVFQYDLCHIVTALTAPPPRGRPRMRWLHRRFTAGLHTAVPQAARIFGPPYFISLTDYKNGVGCRPDLNRSLDFGYYT